MERQVREHILTNARLQAELEEKHAEADALRPFHAPEANADPPSLSTALAPARTAGHAKALLQLDD